MHLRKGDTVQIITGDDRGTKESPKKGRVLKTFPEKNRVIVEGINFILRHTRPSQRNPQGGRVEREAPIHASNVLLVCPHCSQGTRVAIQVLNDGTRARACKRCHEVIASA